ncbi:hypothetical protein FN846DRAFT_892510 [Sphaerosporella brunnea]|uniref:Uncharacterized protein n=1 Tax=Sphaerosporella brunnea TaxID=1250544 RepID=A0A5J5ENZ3_9PEZI|nr:hypothetical protein FN846DRAFT_892510 [Sphaerosporella brunnea]
MNPLPPRFGGSPTPAETTQASRKKRRYETPLDDSQNGRIQAAVAGMNRNQTLHHLGCLHAALEVQAAELTRQMAGLIAPLLGKIDELEAMLAKIAPACTTAPAAIPKATVKTNPKPRGPSAPTQQPIQDWSDPNEDEEMHCQTAEEQTAQALANPPANSAAGVHAARLRDPGHAVIEGTQRLTKVNRIEKRPTAAKTTTTTKKGPETAPEGTHPRLQAQHLLTFRQ